MIEFDHSKNTLSASLGISEERSNEIDKIARDFCYKGSIISKSIEDFNNNEVNTTQEKIIFNYIIGFYEGYFTCHTKTQK